MTLGAELTAGCSDKQVGGRLSDSVLKQNSSRGQEVPPRPFVIFTALYDERVSKDLPEDKLVKFKHD